MLSGKTVIITGASGALGKAAMEAVEDAGGKTVLFDLDFPEDGVGDRPCYEIDLTDLEAVKAVVSRVGDFDAVFNIAGGFAMGEKAYDDSDHWGRMMAMNADTVRHMTIAAMPTLLKKEAGAMVNIGAYAALNAPGEMGAYTASKRVVMNLTETLANEVRGKGVNVNAVLPTILDTPANRDAMPDADPTAWVSPARLAKVMVFLASDAAVDIHGALLPVRGRS